MKSAVAFFIVYYPPIRPLSAGLYDKVFENSYGQNKKKDNLIYYPSSNSSSPTVTASPPRDVPEPPKKERKLSKDAALLMSDTHEDQDHLSSPEEENWLADSGASYHTTFDEKDFDPGTIQECDITVRIGDN